MENITILDVIAEDEPNCVMVTMTADIGEGEEQLDYTLRFNDPHGIAPQVQAAFDEWVLGGGIVDAYTPPLEPPPTETPLTRVQFKAILAILGVTQEQVFTAIDTVVTDPVQNAIAKARVTDSQQYERQNILFDQLGPLLGFTSQQVDAAWPTALSI